MVVSQGYWIGTHRMSVRLIGDVHAKLPQYYHIAANSPDGYSIQVGDLSFDYKTVEQNLNTDKHKFFGGNHDNYNVYNEAKGALGHYGNKSINGFDFFFMRGAFSIDKAYCLEVEKHTGVKMWWRDEELNQAQLDAAYKLYCKTKPNVVLTHDAPNVGTKDFANTAILQAFGFNPITFSTATQVCLNRMWNYHAPKLWVFGHYHKAYDAVKSGTRFVCLPELGFLDIET